MRQKSQASCAPNRRPDQLAAGQSSFSVERGSGRAARGVLPLIRRLRCRSTRNTNASVMPVTEKYRGGAELLSPTISSTTTSNATPAVPSIIELRNTARRSFSARCSYLFTVLLRTIYATPEEIPAR